jgi:hypothetical protein
LSTRRTLSIQEVGDRNKVGAIGVDRLVFEHVVGMALRTGAHVLLA